VTSDPVINIRQLLESRVASTPQGQFLFDLGTNRVFTYSEFNLLVGHAAELLLSLGVKQGDRVSLLLTNRAAYLIFYFACFKIGAWAGPVNALLKSHEIDFIVNNSEAAVAVTQPDLYPALAQCREHLPLLHDVILVSEDQTEEDPPGGITKYTLPTSKELSNLRSELPPAEIASEDEAVIIYTSGTTGKPKGVLLTHGNLLSNARQIADWLSLTSDDRALLIMPLFHVNALMTTCLASLWAGGSVVLAPKFSASQHWDMVRRYNVTYFGSVATMLSLLNQTHPEGLPAGKPAQRLRFALCGSAPVPIEVMKKFEEIFKCPVIEGYGLSESTCRSTFNPPDERRRPGSVGLSIGNEIKVFNEDDRELDHKAIGEIVLRGPNIMKGYYKNDEATNQAFRSGWFHTGDLGYRDSDGFFYVVDRKSDMIIRGGENIYPREIDEVLYQHPEIKDAATIGVPDPLFGEEVKSFVVLRESSQATESEIMKFCRDRLADFKCPKQIEFLKDIPKGPTGKLLKRELSLRSNDSKS
jgi:long-chain acyl-CoA synthetase